MSCLKYDKYFAPPGIDDILLFKFILISLGVVISCLQAKKMKVKDSLKMKLAEGSGLFGQAEGRVTNNYLTSVVKGGSSF